MSQIALFSLSMGVVVFISGGSSLEVCGSERYVQAALSKRSCKQIQTVTTKP